LTASGGGATDSGGAHLDRAVAEARSGRHARSGTVQDPEDDKPIDRFVKPSSAATAGTQGQDELLGAVSWYFSEHNLKIQTDVGPVNNYGVKDQAGDVTNRHGLRCRVQAQLIFWKGANGDALRDHPDLAAELQVLYRGDKVQQCLRRLAHPDR
jgi:hypothetical protein